MDDCQEFSDYLDQLQDALDRLSDYAWDQSAELGQLLDDAIAAKEAEAEPQESEEDDDGEDGGVYAEDCETAQYQHDEAVEWIGYAEQGIDAYRVSGAQLEAVVNGAQEAIGAAEGEISRLQALFAATEDAAIPGQIEALEGLIRGQEGAIATAEHWIGLVDEAIARLERNRDFLGFLKNSADEILAICASGSLPPEPSPEPDFDDNPFENFSPESREEEMSISMAQSLLLYYGYALDDLGACRHAVDEGKPLPDPSYSQLQFDENGYPIFFIHGPEDRAEVFGDPDADYPDAEDDYDPDTEPERDLLPDDGELEDAVDGIEADLELYEEVEEVLEEFEDYETE